MPKRADTLPMRSRELVFFFIFALLALQMFLAVIQIRAYQKAVRARLGKGILGIGQRRGSFPLPPFKPGELLILVYDRREDRVVEVQSMRGWTVFASFRELPEYRGLSLEELRQEALRRGAAAGRRKGRAGKKQDALLQAVEAVDARLRREAAEASP